MENYPTPNVECKDSVAAELLLELYAGAESELTAVMLYSYQHMVNAQCEPEAAGVLMQISLDEMRHLELLGETIYLLGICPVYRGGGRMCKSWCACNLTYARSLREMIQQDIEGERAAVAAYRDVINQLSDRNIIALLERIIEDEQRHIQMLRQLLNA